MGFYLKQLLAGKDFATTDRFAGQMANFVYLLGDDKRRECMVVDPAWDVPGIIDYVDREGMSLVGALVTHYHPDHIGGEIFGHKISGLGELLSLRPVRIHVNAVEADGVRLISGVSNIDLERHDSGDEVLVGEIRIKLIHTPGHTPGSQCFLIGDAIVSGDTLFIGGCGRVDLPGGNATEMYQTLTQVLAKLPDETVLYPGHDYADRPSSTIGEEKRTNYTLRMSSLDDWLMLQGRN